MRATVALVVVATLISAFALQSHAAIVFDNGPPNQANGNEDTEWVQAEDFILPEDTLLTDVHFWTIENAGAWDGTMQWFLFTDNGGVPAAAPFQSGNGGNVVKQPTGGTVLGLTEYEYDFDLDNQVVLQGGVTYWLGLHQSLNYDFDGIWWETTGASTVTGATGHQSAGGTFDNWFDNGLHHAFYLTGEPADEVIPEPSSVALAALGLVGVGLCTWPRRRR